MYISLDNVVVRLIIVILAIYLLEKLLAQFSRLPLIVKQVVLAIAIILGLWFAFTNNLIIL